MASNHQSWHSAIPHSCTASTYISHWHWYHSAWRTASKATKGWSVPAQTPPKRKSGQPTSPAPSYYGSSCQWACSYL